MAVKRIEPDEAARLMEDGWRYVDVRSVPEFEQGHAPGAYNVPLLHFEAGRGMTPNARFLQVFQAAFELEDRLIIGCKSGGRSARAADLLSKAGFAALVDMRGGYSGEIDKSGAVVCAGWSARGLPCTTECDAGRDYDSIRSRDGEPD